MLLGYKDAENEDVNIAEVALELEERWENVVRNVRDRNNQFEGHGDEEFCVRLHKTLVHELMIAIGDQIAYALLYSTVRVGLRW